MTRTFSEKFTPPPGTRRTHRFSIRSSPFKRWKSGEHDGKSRIAEHRENILVASIDDRPLALSFFVDSTYQPPLAEIYSFYGHPDGWGSGIATVLMADTLACLGERGFGRVHLWTLRDTPTIRVASIYIYIYSRW